MAKFIIGKDLEKTVYDIIWESKEILLIVCPYIKFDAYCHKTGRESYGETSLKNPVLTNW
jgi:hypothetical protein